MDIANEWLKLGIQQHEVGNFEGAIASFDQALKIKPGGYDVWYNRGKVLNNLERYEEAIASFDQALKFKLDFQPAWFNRGNVLSDLGQYEKAIASFDQALKFKPDYPQAWNNRGVALNILGRHEEAIASCDEALKIQPNYHHAWNNRGNALSDLGRYEEAIISYNKAVKIKPDFYEAWNNLGVALDNLKRYEEAVAAFGEAVKFKPNYYHAWYRQGLALGYLGQHEEAVAAFGEAVKFKPDFYEPWYDQGFALIHLEQYEDAITAFDKAVKFKPENIDAWYGQGFALNSLGRYEEAIVSYDKAIKIKPDFHKAWDYRGNTLSSLGRYEEAISSYNKAVEIKPDFHEAWNNLGNTLSTLGRHEEAIAFYNKAVEIKLDFHEAWHNRGRALDKLELYEEAIASYNKAVEIKPDFHEAWYNRGVALMKLERYEEAIAAFDETVKIKPDFHKAWNNWGMVLIFLGQYEDAIKIFDEVLKIQPNYYKPWLNRGSAAGKSSSCAQFLALSSTIARQNPDLNQRGYEGALASYEEGLKYCQQDTDPEGWGCLHQAIGNAHYFQGVGKVNYRRYWEQAEDEYHQALITLTKETFPELHLQVLRDLIRVLFGLGRDEEAKQWRRQALEVFGQLLNSPDKSSFQKRKLEAQFSGFSQMRVDVLIEDGDFVPALEAAERNKNFYLTWILDNQKEHILSPNYSQIQELVNPKTAPNTAIIYWHLSPFALTTFVIKPDADKPIVIATQKPTQLEAWIENWDTQYKNYRQAKKQQSSNTAWRENLSQLLEQLGHILNIPCIIESIQNSNSQTQNLVLIPHRDLHRFPLHALFPVNFIINYLPSAQIGLTLNSQSQNSQQTFINSPKLLIVECSGAGRQNEGLERLTYAEIESAAIAKVFENNNPKHIPDNQAHKTTVKQALAAGYNIFHFTGHGSYDSKRPKNSALYLSHDSTDTQTNPDLTLLEIRNLNLSGYQLVCLSACETAITGNETIKSEYVGLVSAFLYQQGVFDVVSSLWTVNEISTSLLMIYFYSEINKGKTPNIALAEATKWLRHLTYKELERFYQISFSHLQQEDSSRIVLQTYLESIKNTTDKLFDHPYHWAGFTITGI